MPVTQAAIVADAEWLAHRYDAVRDEVQFRLVPRARHGEVPFLTDECLGEAERVQPVKLRDAVAQAPAGRLHFIFHSAFCASTLLARAFDMPGVAMGLSEPVILNDIVGIRRRGAQPREVARMIDGAMRLLARPFDAGEAVIVKPSNVFGPLAEAALRLDPEARALFLYAPLPDFLVSVAKKGMWCRLWARELLEGLLQDRVVDLGFTPQDFFRQTDLQVAAIGWLAQHAMFARLADGIGPERLRTLSSETLLEHPAKVLRLALDHFGIEADADRVDAVLAGPAFARHSKFGGNFTAEDRRRENEAAGRAHSEEISKVAQWAKAVAENAGIDLAPHNTLLD